MSQTFVQNSARRILVTGATGGIGAAIARKFVDEGDLVFINDIPGRMSDLEQLKSELSDGTGSAEIVVGDVGDPQSVQDMMKEISVAGNGSIDVVINNAGILSNFLVADLDPDEWDRIYRINTKGPFLVSKYAVPLLKLSAFPSIINIASTGGKRGSPTKSHYGSSKAAVISFTRILAMELASAGIRVNAVCPGVVATEMGKNNIPDEESLQKVYDMTALRRLGEPEDIVGTVSFFASKDSAFVTGQTLNVCGGILFD